MERTKKSTVVYNGNFKCRISSAFNNDSIEN